MQPKDRFSVEFDIKNDFFVLIDMQTGMRYPFSLSPDERVLFNVDSFNSLETDARNDTKNDVRRVDLSKLKDGDYIFVKSL